MRPASRTQCWHAPRVQLRIDHRPQLSDSRYWVPRAQTLVACQPAPRLRMRMREASGLRLVDLRLTPCRSRSGLPREQLPTEARDVSSAQAMRPRLNVWVETEDGRVALSEYRVSLLHAATEHGSLVAAAKAQGSRIGRRGSESGKWSLRSACASSRPPAAEL